MNILFYYHRYILLLDKKNEFDKNVYWLISEKTYSQKKKKKIKKYRETKARKCYEIVSSMTKKKKNLIDPSVMKIN